MLVLGLVGGEVGRGVGRGDSGLIDRGIGGTCILHIGLFKLVLACYWIGIGIGWLWDLTVWIRWAQNVRGTARAGLVA